MNLIARGRLTVFYVFVFYTTGPRSMVPGSVLVQYSLDVKIRFSTTIYGALSTSSTLRIMVLVASNERGKIMKRLSSLYPSSVKGKGC